MMISQVADLDTQMSEMNMVSTGRIRKVSIRSNAVVLGYASEHTAREALRRLAIIIFSQQVQDLRGKWAAQWSAAKSIRGTRMTICKVVQS